MQLITNLGTNLLKFYKFKVMKQPEQTQLLDHIFLVQFKSRPHKARTHHELYMLLLVFQPLLYFETANNDSIITINFN